MVALYGIREWGLVAVIGKIFIQDIEAFHTLREI